jgi:SPX domain protein involved in polyphosphate accumulation
MSFRKEIKFSLNRSKMHQFLKWIENQGAKKLHEERIINSVYFDNKRFNMYHDSVEGIIPRKKVRLRNYNNEKKYLFEKKISSPEGRFKVSKNFLLYNEVLKKGILDDQYGVCEPKIVVNYKRSYFSYQNFRITLDKDISYSKFNKDFSSNLKFRDDELVAEVKGNNLNQDFFDNHFPFITSRFSKYCRGVDMIFNNKI